MGFLVRGLGRKFILNNFKLGGSPKAILTGVQIKSLPQITFRKMNLHSVYVIWNL
jgi:hypothetical protein